MSDARRNPNRPAPRGEETCLSANELKAYAHYMRTAQMLGREPTIDEAFPALQKIRKYQRWTRVAERRDETPDGHASRDFAERGLKRLLERAAFHMGKSQQQIETLRAEIMDKAHRLALQCLDPHGPYRDNPRALKEARDTAAAFLRIVGASDEQTASTQNVQVSATFGAQLPEAVEEELQQLRDQVYRLQREKQDGPVSRLPLN